MRIDRNSYGTLALVYLVCTLIAVAVIIFVPALDPRRRGRGDALGCVWQTAFFRVPKRKHTAGPQELTSVADGKVVILEKVFEPEFLKSECIQLSVYMNFFDVHANFWPAGGEVKYYRYYPGEHFLAFKPKASEENEHTCVGMRLPGGQEILFKQLAGGFARRIVCHAQEGTTVEGGTQCGIIKFGSRIDMYLPLDAKIRVKVGDLVRACETVLAEL